MNTALKFYNKLHKLPMGKKIFTYLVCINAPYFKSIKPLFVDVQPGRCEVLMKKRKSITNHIKTVHAIAMCNLVELTGGMCTDVSLPQNIRWIPKGMTVEYLDLVKSDLRGICIIDLEKLKTWDMSKDFPAEVNLFNTSGKIVMKGIINIHLSLKKK